jgi:hypothetical protein
VTPLLISCSNGHAECTAALLEHGASPNKTDAIGFTPLYISCGKGHAGCARVLLSAKADTEAQQRESSASATALYVASQCVPPLTPPRSPLLSSPPSLISRSQRLLLFPRARHPSFSEADHPPSRPALRSLSRSLSLSGTAS